MKRLIYIESSICNFMIVCLNKGGEHANFDADFMIA